MTLEEILYTEIGEAIQHAAPGKMFDKSCFTVDRKAFIFYHENCMLFRLDAERRQEALALSSAGFCDPSGKKVSSSEWVRVPFRHRYLWPTLAKAACDYVRERAVA